MTTFNQGAASGASNAAEQTGRFIVTFREGAHAQALSALHQRTGLGSGQMMSSADFNDGRVDLSQLPAEGGVVFEHLGMALVSAAPSAVGALAMDAGDDSAILAVEPELIVHALSTMGNLSGDYLRGFRDAANSLCARAGSPGETEEDREAEIEALYADTAALTWGLQASKAGLSAYSGKDIKLAILDTGLDLSHPDFVGRPIVAQSFIPDVDSVQDGHGHGTHCTGTACGPKTPAQGRRYGIAYKAQLHVAKVLSDQGSGADGGILAAINWAIDKQCSIVSMSLGANAPTPSVFYEHAGQRALDKRCLIIAAAGNNRMSNPPYGFVGRPANSRSILSVGAVDESLRIAEFSARDTMRYAGSAVDIVGPGVNVYSSWPMPARFRALRGTSMATPHVAGIAALWAEKTGDRGAALWQRLMVNARVLGGLAVDVGRGLVQAP